MAPPGGAGRPARPWLFAVARNLAIDSCRARQARPAELGEAALRMLSSGDDADRTLESWAVAGALASLRPEHRRVIVETLLSRLLGRRGVGHAGHTGGHREVEDLLCAEGTEACHAGTRAGDVTELWDCAQARVSLGVYLLRAIDPAERALVDVHLATCRECWPAWPACPRCWPG
jgi:hypothetical protein